jgi:3-methyl-2-oxobutanoate hydroxymethyltransferase
MPSSKKKIPAKDQPRRRVTPTAVRRAKTEGRRLTMVTAEDYPMARAADRAGIYMLLVSDALGQIALGRDDVYATTVDEMIHHTRAVRAGSGACLVVVSLPFATYADTGDAVRNAARLVAEGGAHAVHIEGSAATATMAGAVVGQGIPVIGHVGLNRMKILARGGFRIIGKDVESAHATIDDALALEQAGAFAMILECVTAEVAAAVTGHLGVPTIGIGSGKGCDGQGLVSQDMLGMFDKFCPSFVKQYADLGRTVTEAFGRFRGDVEGGRFPRPAHATPTPAEVMKTLAGARRR